MSKAINVKIEKKDVRRKASADLGSMIYGKIPPQAREFEVAILGAIMQERDAYDVASEIIKPEAFYLDAHQRIFKAIQRLSNKSQPIDILTVTEELRSSEELEMVGGPYFITQLTNSVVSSAHIEKHCRVVLEKFMKRELIRLNGETIQNAFEDGSDVFDLLDDFEREYTELTNLKNGKKIIGIDHLLVQRIQRMEELRHNKQHITGIPSGFRDIDKITHGWQTSDLIILAARPSVGKTALALNLAKNAALNQIKSVPVGLFSLEMSSGQLTDRIISSSSEVWLEKISNGMLEDSDMRQIFEQGAKPLSHAEIFIDDTPALNIYELRSKARMLKRKKNIGLIIIDYLQLMSGDNERSGNREQEISKISRGLKALAKELNIPIIALSQLSREPDKRKGDAKTPQLSDLRESGAIEQDADLVMFMYRPEYYDVDANEMGESVRGETHISISKHRNGKLAKGSEVIKLRAQLDIQKFHNWESQGSLQFPAGPGNWKPVDLGGNNNDDLPFK